MPSAHAIEREYKVQKALEKSNVPCPKMIKLCEDEKIIGTSFYLMNIIEGRVFESILDIKIKISGFDPGTGLPNITEKEDLPFFWKGGDYTNKIGRAHV